jgi:hypothetical protein
VVAAAAEGPDADLAAADAGAAEHLCRQASRLILRLSLSGRFLFCFGVTPAAAASADATAADAAADGGCALPAISHPSWSPRGGGEGEIQTANQYSSLETQPLARRVGWGLMNKTLHRQNKTCFRNVNPFLFFIFYYFLNLN